MALFKRGQVWWCKFYFAGQEIRESSKSNSKTVAKNAEQQRRKELAAGYHNLKEVRQQRIRYLSDVITDYLVGYRLRYRSPPSLNTRSGMFHEDSAVSWSSTLLKRRFSGTRRTVCAKRQRPSRSTRRSGSCSRCLETRARSSGRTGVAALTAAAIYRGHSHSHKVSLESSPSVETMVSQPMQATPNEQPSTPQEPTETKDLRKAAPSGQPKASVASSPPSTKAKRADRAHDRPQLDAEIGVAVAPDEKAANRSGVSFSPDEINDLIGKADKQVGDGDFDAAINNYRIVLKHDPANVRAKQGIERARRNKGSD